MSSVKVLPTAPQYGETEKLYPVLTASNFRWYIRGQQTEVFPGHRIVALAAVRATI